MIHEIFGYIASLCIITASLPQALQTWRDRNDLEKLEGVSKTTWTIMIVGCISWLVYGYGKMDYPILITNTFAIIGPTLTLTIIYKNRNKSTV